jgi:hypothetical protein
VAFFSKCLLGDLAIFMMADNKEQRVCMKFCFLLGTVRNLTAALYSTKILSKNNATVMQRGELLKQEQAVGYIVGFPGYLCCLGRISDTANDSSNRSCTAPGHCLMRTIAVFIGI